MKLAVLALILGLCLAIASANVDSSVKNEELKEFTPLSYAEGIAFDDEEFSIFGLLFSAITASLRTLKGVNCTIKRVLSIRNAGVDFVNDIKSCNTGALKDLNALANQVQTVVNTCNDIIHVNSNVCNNGDLSNQADGKKTTPFMCFIKLLLKMLSLQGQIAKTITLSKKLPSTATTYGGCNKSSVSNLTSVFTEFPTYVKNCSKLTN